ncbi:hypothetical protein GQX74_015577, partial [Glossina fuscipes]
KSVAKLAKTGAGKGKSPGGEGAGDADDLDAWIKSRQLLKPDDQLKLTEAELGEEITKVLTPTNTNVVHNFVVYSFKEGTFVKISPADAVEVIRAIMDLRRLLPGTNPLTSTRRAEKFLDSNPSA